MSIKGLQKGFFFAVILMITGIILGMGQAEASRRAFNMNSAMEAGMLRNYKGEVSGRLFDVRIRQKSKTDTVKDNGEDMDEAYPVKRSFGLGDSSNCQVFHEFDIE